MDDSKRKSCLKIFALVWIFIECSLVSGNIFGLASLFSELPRYGIYKSECKKVIKLNPLNNTPTTTEDCSDQMKKYQLAFALGIAFYNLPAVVLGIISDNLGPRSLKFIAIICHLIGWLSLGFTEPGRDWLLIVHTIFISLSGIGTLLSSFAISGYFIKSRGLVTSFISGFQITGTIWYAVFQILIAKKWVTLSTLSFIWASFAILMFGSAMLFLDWPFDLIDSTLKTKSTKIAVKTTVQKDSLIKHLKNPLFIVVTLFTSCLLFTISFLPVIWHYWLSYLTNEDSALTERYTFWFNMIMALGIIVAPLCGFIVDFKAHRGYKQKMLNISILQTFTWISCITLCVSGLIPSTSSALVALITMLLSRTLLVAGSQALIATVFPPQFIGSLLGVLWTTAGVFSFAINGLVNLVKTPEDLWRPWGIILILCIILGGHLFQVWRLYINSKNEKKSELPITDEEEMKKLKSSNDN